MKLFFAPSSPFVRKVVVFAAETGLSDAIERINVTTTAVASDADLRAANPSGKIPTLVLNNGMTLFDSRVICQYLDTQHTMTKLYPAEGDDKWHVLRIESLSDAICDAAVIARYESFLRPDDKFWDKWYDAQVLKVTTSLAALEKELPTLHGGLNIAQIAAACALGYVDFRLPDLDWKSAQPELATWYAEFSARPSMVNSVPA